MATAHASTDETSHDSWLRALRTEPSPVFKAELRQRLRAQEPLAGPREWPRRALVAAAVVILVGAAISVPAVRASVARFVSLFRVVNFVAVPVDASRIDRLQAEDLQIGTLVGERTVKRWFRGEKSQQRLAWAEQMLDRRGAYIIVIARFIPGGRTAVTFSAGYIPTFPWRRFVLYDALAASIWATYAAGLGYFGGKTFENHPFLGLMIALGIALSLGFAVEAARHWRQRRAAT